jgi:hypothetical protein
VIHLIFSTFTPFHNNFGILGLSLHSYSVGAGPRDTIDIASSRNHGSRITAITDPSNHPPTSSQRLLAFRCMGISDTRRTASPCSRNVPRGHGVRGGRPALRTAPHAFARENGQRARESQYRKRYVLYSSGRVSWKRQMLPKPDPVLPDYYYHGSQLALLLNRLGAWRPEGQKRAEQLPKTHVRDQS